MSAAAGNVGIALYDTLAQQTQETPSLDLTSNLTLPPFDLPSSAATASHTHTQIMYTLTAQCTLCVSPCFTLLLVPHGAHKIGRPAQIDICKNCMYAGRGEMDETASAGYGNWAQKYVCVGPSGVGPVRAARFDILDNAAELHVSRCKM